MRHATITPRYVEFIPEELEDGMLYISEKYSTAVHKCCCGCGEEVVTPLSPVNWRLQKERATVSLVPSIGNWTLKCKSHYVISRNKVEWAAPFSEKQIRRVRERDHRDRLRYAKAHAAGQRGTASDTSLLDRIWRALKRLWIK